MRNQHDHLGHTMLTRGCSEELDRELDRRDDLQTEEVAVEVERGVHIADPQHDLGEPGDDAAHAATAEIIAARFASLVCGETEHPGASSSPRPSVAAIARRASASTSPGGPYRKLARWPMPPIAARPLIVRPSASDGVPWL